MKISHCNCSTVYLEQTGNQVVLANPMSTITPIFQCQKKLTAGCCSTLDNEGPFQTFLETAKLTS